MMKPRVAMAWTCYWTGDLVSRTVEPLFGRWFSWPYRLYSFLMCAAVYWQGDGPDGPWSAVENREAER